MWISFIFFLTLIKAVFTLGVCLCFNLDQGCISQTNPVFFLNCYALVHTVEYIK